MTTSGFLVAVAIVVAIMAGVLWFDRRCLADLADTSDWELRYFDRKTWALIIVVSFPVGPMMYLLCAKGGPNRPV